MKRPLNEDGVRDIFTEFTYSVDEFTADVLAGLLHVYPRFERVDDMNVYSFTRRSDDRICFRDDGAILLPEDSAPWVKTPIFMQLCRDHNSRLGFTEENFPRPEVSA